MKRSSFIKSLIGLPFVPPLLGRAAVVDQVKKNPITPEECTDCTGKGIFHYENCPRNGNFVYYSRMARKDLDNLITNMTK